MWKWIEEAEREFDYVDFVLAVHIDNSGVCGLLFTFEFHGEPGQQLAADFANSWYLPNFGDGGHRLKVDNY